MAGWGGFSTEILGISLIKGFYRLESLLIGNIPLGLSYCHSVNGAMYKV